MLLRSQRGVRKLAVVAAPGTAQTAEARQAGKFAAFLARRDLAPITSQIEAPVLASLVEAGFAAFALHVEARLASARGEGFYTIGPCGEELSGVLGLLLRPSDSVAWHYRHLAGQIAFHRLSLGLSLDEIILNRARGYVCSALDPVTGGRHCALGGSPSESYVTSTLASQTPPAVGRALADPLMRALRVGGKSERAVDSVHLVSVGDGSIHNAHFLSAFNLARHASFRGVKCPVLFVVTDNSVSISYKTLDWARKGFLPVPGMHTFSCNGTEVDRVWQASSDAFNRCRTEQAPVLLVIHGLPRRFGHAATDRQSAYLSESEITAAEETNPLEPLCLRNAHHVSMASMEALWHDIREKCRRAFELAKTEPKLDSVAEVASMNQAPFPQHRSEQVVAVPAKSPEKKPKKWPMRRFVTASIERELESNPNAVVLGEDIRHGGYYLCTEGLASKFPSRVLDFPPDETTLIGVGMGFSQRGLVPIVEIPYLKYLDCGFDMFQEACLIHWLTRGREKCGMVLRLQGFDRGVFGGNFHTHNTLSFLNPGLDVLCFSNGPDYARGMRLAMRAAQAGRIVAILECTELLNRRHVVDGDDAWLFDPPAVDFERDLDTVSIFGSELQPRSKQAMVVCYGNGVVSALQAREALRGEVDVVVVDCPLLSRCPSGLHDAVHSANKAGVPILFADSCKAGSPNPLSLIAQHLKSSGDLEGTRRWNFVGAADTWNPLSRTVTFLDQDKIVDALRKLVKG